MDIDRMLKEKKPDIPLVPCSSLDQPASGLHSGFLVLGVLPAPNTGIVSISLAINHITLSSENLMLDIDLWSLEPLVCINHPPDHDGQHRRAPHKAGPGHGRRAQVGASNGGQAQDWDHERSEAGCKGANDGAVFAQMPRTLTEAVADQKGADENGNGEGCEGGNGGNAEDSTNRDVAAETSRVSKMPMTVLNQTASTGVCVWRLTLFQILLSGKQSSRAYA
jgi:hypothetical protein